jgi:hypothetical protein
MSESETESVDSVEPVEIKAPEKKKRTPMTEQRRKLMLENLAKGRKTRAENLSNKRLEKEKEQVKKEQEYRCDHCGSQFKYKTSKNKHMKTCKKNPDYIEVEDKPVEIPPKENKNVEVEIKEKKEEAPAKPKENKKKKVVYVSDDSSSDEEIIYKKKKSKRVVYVERPTATPHPPQIHRQNTQPQAPQRPLITEEQKQLILKKRQEDAKYAQMGRMQEANANRIKNLSANMIRKNRF